MDTHPDAPPAAVVVQRPMRWLVGLRTMGRLFAFSVGSWLVVAGGWRAVLSPFPARWRRSCAPVSRWARWGARCLGVRVSVSGAVPPPGSLVVANHQGYADIVTIGGLFPTIFAARHDMRRWPMFGALAAAGATIFINRDVKRASWRGVAQVAAALAAGATVVAFPEGTSTDGRGLLPLRTGVFQAAVEAQAPVVPAAIRYTAVGGRPIDEATRPHVGWYDGSDFFRHLLRLAGYGQVEATVLLGEPIPPPHTDRRSLAAAAEARLRSLLGFAPDQVPEVRGRVSRPEGSGPTSRGDAGGWPGPAQG
jgi:1-acyl-sn-glycerol-3-phosphate acyltransferase